MSESYLITGVAGTGKSTLEREFRNKGYDTIDTDRGYARWQLSDTLEAVPSPQNESSEWYDAHDWMTDTQKLLAKMSAHALSPEPLLVFGNTADLYTLHPYFHRMFALEYRDEDLIRHRIYTRTDNDYGKNPVEFASLLSYYQPMQEKFRSVGMTAIDCSLSLETIVATIERELEVQNTET